MVPLTDPQKFSPSKVSCYTVAYSMFNFLYYEIITIEISLLSLLIHIIYAVQQVHFSEHLPAADHIWSEQGCSHWLWLLPCHRARVRNQQTVEHHTCESKYLT